MKQPERHRLHDHSDDNSGGRLAAQHITGLPTLTTTVTSSGGAANLDDLGDVNAPSPADNDALTWDAATNSWINEAISGSVSYATPAIVLGSSAAAGAASTVIRSDSTIAAFDATVPVTQAFSDTAATGSAAFAARRDHKHGMPASPGGGSGGLTLLGSSVLGADAATMIVSGLSAAYSDLVVVSRIRSALAAAIDNCYMRVGAGSVDTGSNYDEFTSYNGTGTGSISNTGVTRGYLAVCAANSATAGYYTSSSVEIIEYASTTRDRGIFGQSWNGDGSNRYLATVGIHWKNVSGAIDRVEIHAGGGNLKAGSSIYVYGRV